MKPDRLIEVPNGRVPLLLGAVGQASIVKTRGIACVDLDCPTEILNGTVEFALALIGGATKSKGRCIVGLEQDRLIKVL
jgi:hypothetical protein